MNFEKFVAYRYLRSPRSDKSISTITIISIIGVALGVMALIVVLSVMNGFERDLKGALVGANSHLTLYPFGFDDRGIQEHNELIEKLKTQLPVSTIVPFTESQALIMGKNKPRGSLIKGIDPEIEISQKTMESFVRLNQFPGKRTETEIQAAKDQSSSVLKLLKPHWQEYETKSGEKKRRRVTGILIGRSLSNRLNVGLNDFVTIVSPEERISPMGALPRAKKFQVVGFYESGISGYDEVLAFIDLKIAQRVFRMGDRISGISINFDNENLSQKYKEELEKKYGLQYIIRTWIDQNKNLFAVIKLEKLGLGIILTLIILVAAANIISSLIMLVVEKRKDIAILKSLGARNNSILKIFIFEGAIIGLIGTFIGELGGIFICWVIKNFDIIDIPHGVYVGNRVPVYVENSQLFLIAIISFIICFFVTVFPAKKASRLDPVEGLRNV